MAKEISAKPFLKWAGGKTQLLSKIDNYLIFDDSIYKYVEPFVGGGAVLFHVLNNYRPKEIYINDINSSLIDAYSVVKSNVNDLINLLSEIETEYITLDEDERKNYFYNKREIFNILKKANENVLEKSALMIFLNKTCFNGLYRENKSGEFNVPHGKYKNPKICDRENLLAVSNKLKNVEIYCCDYKNLENFIDANTLVYFDPPYKPLSKSGFTSYSKSGFNDDNQVELSQFFKDLNEKGAKVFLSNSDPKSNDGDLFFDDLYKDFNIERVRGNRMINSDAANRGKINEIIVSNFKRRNDEGI